VQQLPQRRAAERVLERVGDRGVRVGQAGQDVGRVDGAGAEREAFEAQLLAVVDQQRRGAFVDLDDDAGAGMAAPFLGVSGAVRSKATLAVPRRPASRAWSIAWRQRWSG
jgi:hypothetical protein